MLILLQKSALGKEGQAAVVLNGGGAHLLAVVEVKGAFVAGLRQGKGRMQGSL